FAGVARIWHLVAIEAVFGAAEAFFRPAATGLLPQTVPEPEIQRASALTGLSQNVAEFAGPALATALVLGLGAGWAFALDAGTFLLSAAFLWRVRPRRRALQRQPGGAAPRTPDAAQARVPDAAPVRVPDAAGTGMRDATPAGMPGVAGASVPHAAGTGMRDAEAGVPAEAPVRVAGRWAGVWSELREG